MMHLCLVFEDSKLIAIVPDGSIHWTNSDLNENVDQKMWWYYPYHAPAADIEMTGYALLAMVENGDIISGLPVAKWLSQQRNSLGGWASTQVAADLRLLT